MKKTSPLTEAATMHGAEWSRLTDAFESGFFNTRLTDEEQSERTIPFVQMLDQMLTLARAKVKLTDGWEASKVLFNIYGLEVIQSHPGRQWRPHFGFSLEGFTFQCNFPFSWHLPSMHDEFWTRLSRLSELGKLEYAEGGMPPVVESIPQNRRLRQKNNSAIFSLIRDAIMVMQSEDTESGPGCLNVTFPRELPWAQLSERLEKAVAISYACAYELYRLNYLEQKRALKIHFKKQGAKQN